MHRRDCWLGSTPAGWTCEVIVSSLPLIHRRINYSRVRGTTQTLVPPPPDILVPKVLQNQLGKLQSSFSSHHRGQGGVTEMGHQVHSCFLTVFGPRQCLPFVLVSGRNQQCSETSLTSISQPGGVLSTFSSSSFTEGM